MSTKFLNTISPVSTDTFGGSGSSHAPGIVPDPGSTAGSARFLREDATWVDPVAGIVGASRPSAAYATTANLSGTYSNGTAGVGATLQASSFVYIGIIDGQTPAIGDLILVKNQTTAAQNGLYTVTLLGSGGTQAWLLTRSTSMDSSAKFTGAVVAVENGTAGANTLWLCPVNAPTVGTTAITFSQLNAGGSGGSGSGTVTSVSVASANGFAGSVATSTTTPAITLTTSITGLLKGNGTAISAATSGTDYAPPASPTFTGTVTTANLTYTGALVVPVLGTTAAADVTLTAASVPYQYIDPNGVNRNVNLPTAATGMIFAIKNKATSGAFYLVVKNAGGTQIGNNVPWGATLVVVYDGTTWQVM